MEEKTCGNCFRSRDGDCQFFDCFRHPDFIREDHWLGYDPDDLCRIEDMSLQIKILTGRLKNAQKLTKGEVIALKKRNIKIGG